MPHKQLTIIISCFNAEKYIADCLHSILNISRCNFEVIVVNDGSTDSTKKRLSSFQSNKKLLVLDSSLNCGPAQSRNKATTYASGEILLFLDVDTQIVPDTLPIIIDYFSSHPTVGAIQCELRFSDRRLDSVGHFLTFTGFPHEIGHNEPPSNYRYPIEIFGAKSAGMAVRKHLFQTISGFDNDYMIYGEDTDLSWRIKKAGFQIHFVPNSIVYHVQKSSMNKQTRNRVYYEGAKNNTNYIIKNAQVRDMLYLLPLHLLVWIALSVRLLLQSNTKASSSILCGLWWNVQNLSSTLKKRKDLARIDVSFSLYESKISIIKLVKKGWRWFVHV